MTPFAELSLDPRLLRSMQHLGFSRPTEIQQEAIPAVLSGKDLLVSSRTGSGKTLAYLLPMMQRLLKSKPLSQKDARALILAPTRELATQVYGQLRLLVANTRINAALIIGGENFNDQEKLLKRQPEIIVATPGRFTDHLSHRSVFIEGLELLILDEADRMLDLGFASQLLTIHKAANHRLRQTLLFSATLDQLDINELALALLNRPHRITTDDAHKQHADIQQYFYLCDHLSHKEAILEYHLKQETIKQVIIFTATRADTDRLAVWCQQLGFQAIGLSGQLSQAKRNAVMQDFARGNVQILITTDVASRGLDLLQVSHVFNFDLPKFAEEYVHRVGRTGRAGMQGKAISLVGPKDWPSLQLLEAFFHKPIQFDVIESLPARFTGKVTAKKPTKAVAKKKTSTAKAKATVSKRNKPSDSVIADKKQKGYTAGDDGDIPVLRKKS
ncbi:DEAD/DEAH box helicase [Alkalimonas collagenimarina]|uniref:DEAD/DEAH box helicase n=1 Tax=Alkalimonas collagenimarina TaxID=400390 RepID=A0ABT9GU55_9GAMM|nr:DEAD/DEAH box helicase [Alkalimonas collagenimarina]MDP4534585.1 DEAD/DEAH box helicase [Alkalimonas collagenimarina]